MLPSIYESMWTEPLEDDTELVRQAALRIEALNEDFFIAAGRAGDNVRSAPHAQDDPEQPPPNRKHMTHELSRIESGTVVIDGSHGEGGGQILRTGLSLAAITGRPAEIVNIRAARTNPGLRPQHLAAVHAARAICGADVSGAEIGSRSLTFVPGAAVIPGTYRFKIGTAGAATLVLQTVLIPLALALSASDVTVTGGTHVPHAPTAEYLEQVHLAALNRIGIESKASVTSFGFFPKGGGEMSMEIGASHLSAIDLVEKPAKLNRLTAYISTSNLPSHVDERGGRTFMELLRVRNLKSARVVPCSLPSPGPGAAVTLVAETASGAVPGFSAIGERGKPMERVVAEACEQFWLWHKSSAACDEHLADQLVLAAAVTSGKHRWSTVRVTEHLRTALWVAKQFLPIETEIEKREDGSGLVTVVGAAKA